MALRSPQNQTGKIRDDVLDYELPKNRPPRWGASVVLWKRP